MFYLFYATLIELDFLLQKGFQISINLAVEHSLNQRFFKQI